MFSYVSRYSVHSLMGGVRKARVRMYTLCTRSSSAFTDDVTILRSAIENQKFELRGTIQ